LGTGAFLGLLPFSAIIVRRATQASRPVAARPQVFTTSRQDRRPQRFAGLFHPAGTPRVSVSRGHNLIDRVLFPVPGSYAVILSFMASFHVSRAVPDRPAIAPLRWRRPYETQPLTVYETAGCHHGLGPALERCSRPGPPHLAKGFHPPGASAPLLTLSPSGFSSPAALGRKALPLSGLLPP
jgi:hypothetical protein